jgi:hypothetical protein
MIEEDMGSGFVRGNIPLAEDVGQIVRGRIEKGLTRKAGQVMQALGRLVDVHGGWGWSGVKWAKWRCNWAWLLAAVLGMRSGFQSFARWIQL